MRGVSHVQLFLEIFNHELKLRASRRKNSNNIFLYVYCNGILNSWLHPAFLLGFRALAHICVLAWWFAISIRLKNESKSNIFRDFLLPGIGIEQNMVEETLLDIAGEEAETFIDDPESCFFIVYLFKLLISPKVFFRANGPRIGFSYLIWKFDW